LKGKYITPFLRGEAFNCVSCHVFTKQHWYFMRGSTHASGYGGQQEDDRFLISYCEHCGFPTIWHGEAIIFPLNLSAEPPNEDIPEDVKADYEEARAIFNLSPRGAAALLRLGIQKLCAHLGQPGKNINADIKALVQAGLPSKVQEALDSVRVIGNDAVHPGTIDLNDDRDTANQLFRLVNFIAHKMITEPKEIDEIYNNLPADKLKGIKDRDSK
jgi:hypothetical protein